MADKAFAVDNLLVVCTKKSDLSAAHARHRYALAVGSRGLHGEIVGNLLRILQLVKELPGEGYGVLLSTHNPQHALSFATRILALSDGKVAALGNADEVLTPALVKQLYHVDVTFTQTQGANVLVPLMD